MNYFAILNKPIDKDNDVKFNNKYIHLELNNKLKHWNPSIKNGVTLLILGKPTIDLNEWSNFKTNEESYIINTLLDKYLELDLNTFSKELNGAFSIILLDSNKNQIIIITDKLGMFPIYSTNDELESLQISSHTDILASNLKKTNIDKLSIAEFLKNGFINIPNTYYHEIKVLEHRSYFVLDFKNNKVEEKRYFEFKSKETDDFSYLVEKLSKSLVKAIERRTNEYYGSKAVLLSGGADSRSILYNAMNNTEAITLYNNKNSEISTTEKISKRLNTKHHLIKRDFDHYIDVLEDSILTNGGMSEITSEHYLTYKNNEIFDRYDLFLTGCYFDYMFKGLTLNTKNISLFGKALPYKVLSEVKDEFYVGTSAISQEYDENIQQRNNQNFSKSINLIELESQRSFPFHREHDSVMRLSLLREFNSDFIVADNDLIDCFLSIPPKYKINAQVFDKAIENITQNINDIPHANKKVKIGTHPYMSVLLTFIRFIKNKIQKTKIDKVVGDGSWINFNEYARTSEKVNNVWKNMEEEERKIVTEILDYNPWEKGKEFILNQKKGHHLFFRIITFSKWHEMYRKDLLLKK
ncbi:hypothetical protein CRU96_09335 [Malaciobacter halophilus]|nr:asparagine synthase-related protein [Malaciobacter halophilus]RYA23172.1 hypothetical protein CRU96_09335 [Malaciobacter halophilus]